MHCLDTPRTDNVAATHHHMSAVDLFNSTRSYEQYLRSNFGDVVPSLESSTGDSLTRCEVLCWLGKPHAHQWLLKPLCQTPHAKNKF
jgi:hypothetical protein